MDSEKRRLIHSIEFLKDPYNVCEFIIALLSLNVSIEEMHQVIKWLVILSKKTLKVFDQVESKLIVNAIVITSKKYLVLVYN